VLDRQIFEATLALDAVTDHRELALRDVVIARSLERIAITRWISPGKPRSS
jgi:hypothetical protein